MSIRRLLSVPAVVVVLALGALALPAGALAVERTVSVEATATVRVPNDSASIGLGVSLERGSRGAALRAASAKLQRVIGAVQAIPGVGDGDVKTGRVSVRETREGRFRASEGIGVTLHEPARAGELVQAAIGAGATGVRGPSYFVGDQEAAFASALAAAFAKAKSKATILAAQAGATLGPALAIDEGGNAEIVPFDQEKAAAAPTCGASSQPATKDAPGPKAAPGAKGAPTTQGGPAAERAGGDCATPPPTKPGVSTVTATVGVVFAFQ